MPRPLPLLAALFAVGSLTTGCALGERPTLSAAEVVTDPAAQTVLERLDRRPAVDFTAEYTITPTSTGAATSSTVTRSAGVTTTRIGDVTYTTDAGGSTSTCRADGTPCTDGADDALVSNLGVTHQFWNDSTRQRLATDSARRIGTSTGSTATIAGQAAVCVAIKLPSSVEAVGTVGYCALDHGVVGRYVGADTVIELTAFEVAAAATEPASD